jgi:hypothetical protein
MFSITHMHLYGYTGSNMARPGRGVYLSSCARQGRCHCQNISLIEFQTATLTVLEHISCIRMTTACW